MKFKLSPELKNVLTRAGWTAVQSFLAVWMVADVDSLKAAAVAGLAAGLSVVKTYVMEKAKKMSAGKDTDAS
jgi:hypothetical protein